MSENDLHDVLAQALSDSAPDPQVMANAAAAHGRVLRRRRAMAQVAGSTAAVVLVAGGIGVGLAHGGGSGRPGGSALVQPEGGGKVKATPTSPAAPDAPAFPNTSRLSPTAPTTGADGNNGQWGPPLTADRIATHTPYADLLAQLLPGGLTKKTAGFTPKGGQDGRVQVDDGRGLAMIKVVGTYGDSALGTLPDCGNNGFSTVTDCRLITVGTTQVRVMRIDGEPDAQQHGVYYWDAVALFKDGTYVSIGEINAARDGNPPTRTEPPVSLDQLAQIAANPQWQPLAKAGTRNS